MSERFIIPDSHGLHIDPAAESALIRDLRNVRPKHIILLGDHLDCGGTFSAHQRTYTLEMSETYADDCKAANNFLDRIQEAAPSAEIDYLEGNHEQHVERWAARNFERRKDADMLVEKFGPEAVLQLKDRGIKYFKRTERYQGLSIPGTIKRGKCYFTHGIAVGRAGAQRHIDRFGANVVFGHCHISISLIERTVTSDGHGAWSPGTLAKLQPLYMHTAPSNWSQGYALQELAKSGRFLHLQVPIHKGKSLLMDTARALTEKSRRR